MLCVSFLRIKIYDNVGYLSSASIDQQIKTMGIIQNISYDKSRYCSISLDEAYFKHIYCETNTDNVGYKDTSISTSLYNMNRKIL